VWALTTGRQVVVDVRLSVTTWNGDEGWLPIPGCVWLAGSVTYWRKENASKGDRLIRTSVWLCEDHRTSIRRKDIVNHLSANALLRRALIYVQILLALCCRQ
jgi:hypothetical protein